MKFVFRIEAQSGYLLVWQSGCPTIPDLAAMQSALELAAARYRIWRVLFDNRAELPEEVREFMISWLDRAHHFDAQAIVLNSNGRGMHDHGCASKRVHRRGLLRLRSGSGSLFSSPSGRADVEPASLRVAHSLLVVIFLVILLFWLPLPSERTFVVGRSGRSWPRSGRTLSPHPERQGVAPPR